MDGWYDFAVFGSGSIVAARRHGCVGSFNYHGAENRRIGRVGGGEVYLPPLRTFRDNHLIVPHINTNFYGKPRTPNEAPRDEGESFDRPTPGL